MKIVGKSRYIVLGIAATILLVLLTPTPTSGQLGSTGQSGGKVPKLPHHDDDSDDDWDSDGDVDDDDVGAILINIVRLPQSNGTGKGAGANVIPEVEMMKLKAATKGAGLSDAKADRVVRAVKALDLKYNEVVDLKKVMINPATSADYAERVRRALEDAVVDKHMNKNADLSSNSNSKGNASGNSNSNDIRKPNKTVATLAESDLTDPFSRRDSNSADIPKVSVLHDNLGQPQPQRVQFVGTSNPSGPHVFFGTPMKAKALPEDLENLWILGSHVIGRKDAFELVQLCYLLKITRSEVFDLQHDFASGAMNKQRATKLIGELSTRLLNESKSSKPNQNQPIPSELFNDRISQLPPNTPKDQTTPNRNPTPIDLSQPLDPASLHRLKTAAELSGVDKSTSTRLVRAVMDSGLDSAQVHQVSDVIQNNAATPEDLQKFIDHLEETEMFERGLDSEGTDFVSTPEQAQGADWIFDSKTTPN